MLVFFVAMIVSVVIFVVIGVFGNGMVVFVDGLIVV